MIKFVNNKAIVKLRNNIEIIIDLRCFSEFCNKHLHSNNIFDIFSTFLTVLNKIFEISNKIIIRDRRDIYNIIREVIKIICIYNNARSRTCMTDGASCFEVCE